jgi:peptide/nickel transport system substrate-binding protein
MSALARFLRVIIKSAVIAAGIVVVCTSACSGIPARSVLDQSTSKVVLTIGYPHTTGQDPLHGARHAADLISLEGLTTQTLNGRPVPRLAEGWDETSDGLAWNIRLRPSAVFHDGTPVDAQSVKRSLDQFLTTGAGRSSLGLQDITALEVTGQHSLQIRLGRRSTILLDELDTALITKKDNEGRIIGTGPYVVTSTSANEIAMSAFPQYYRGVAAIDQLVWRLFPTVRTAWAAMMRREVDFLYEVGPESREFLESEASVRLYPFRRNYIYGVVFNAGRPLFHDNEFRKALNYAVDRRAIVERVFRGHASVASGPAWPLHWAFDPSAATYIHDPSRAAATLERMADSVSRTPANFRFVCLIPENFQLWESMALMVQRDLAKIGVNMLLESLPFEEYNRRIAEKNFDAVLIEMISGFNSTRPLWFWHSSGLYNFSSYKNDLVDASLERIKRAPGEGEYREGFRQFQSATFEDPPAIFLTWGETARAVNRRFEVVKAPGGDIRMTISDWQLADAFNRAAN